MDRAAARGICRPEGVGEGRGVGGANLVAIASDQSNDARAQDREVGRQLCRPGDEEHEWFRSACVR